jgi:4'-phosphopantetheinyl transferase EntD
VELQQFEQYRFPKRQREWLSGRLACKKAVAELVGLKDLTAIIVANDDHGKPFITGEGCSGIEVSISHSGKMAMALAAHVPCGLDVQEITPTLAKVQDKFVRNAELERLPGFKCQVLAQFGLVWAAKEALRKLLPLWPLLGFLEAEIDQILQTEGGFLVQCSTIINKRPLPHYVPEVYAALHDDYALALCFESQHKE